MKKTQTYQLNQWDGDDRILREDFNADNAKIDAALNAEEQARKRDRTELNAAVAQAARFVKLKDITLSANTQYIEVDISDIAWGNWQNVHLDINLHNGSQGYLFVNRFIENNYDCNRLSYLYLGAEPMPRLSLAVGKMPERPICPGIAYQDARKLIFTGATFNAQGKIVIWGEA